MGTTSSTSIRSMSSPVSRRGRLRRCFIDTARLDTAEIVKFAPKLFCGLATITVEVATTDTDELPSCSFKVALASHVLFVALRAVPFIAVAFDSETPLHPFDDEINTVTMIGRVTNAHLRAYIKSPVGNQLKHVALKLRIKPAICPLGRLAARVKHIAQ